MMDGHQNSFSRTDAATKVSQLEMATLPVETAEHRFQPKSTDLSVKIAVFLLENHVVSPVCLISESAGHRRPPQADGLH